MTRRNTIQRSLVLEAVNKLHSHATADEIYNVLVKEHPTISKGTVYRNLKLLCETGDIRKREIPGSADCFDHICTNHYHAKCIKCGHIFDVEMEYMEGIEKSIKNAHGFVFTGHDIVFKGICPKCKDNP